MKSLVLYNTHTPLKGNAIHSFMIVPITLQINMALLLHTVCVGNKSYKLFSPIDMSVCIHCLTQQPVSNIVHHHHLSHMCHTQVLSTLIIHSLDFL